MNQCTKSIDVMCKFRKAKFFTSFKCINQMLAKLKNLINKMKRIMMITIKRK